MPKVTPKPVQMPGSSWGSTLQSLIQAAILNRLLPEVWYLTESWLGPTKGKKVLVIGSTLGFMSEALAKSRWSVTTVDTSVRALKDARTRFSGAGLKGVFELCQPWELPYQFGTFDAVIAIFSLEVYDNSVAILNEIHRVLKPGGPAVISTLNCYSPWNLRLVQRLLHPETNSDQIICFSAKEFAEVLSLSPLKVDKIKKQGLYLPLPQKTLALKFPIPAVFTALITR